MAGRVAGVAGLAALSAVLAGFVYNPLPVDLATMFSGSANAAEASVVRPAVLASVQSVAKLAPATTSTIDASNTLGPVAKPARVRVPVGCDRLVSVLVRSAAADHVGRCVT